MTTLAVATLLAALPLAAMSQDGNGLDPIATMQADFAAAYNRKDVAAMAAFFSDDAVRVTPAGIFRGRDAIGRELRRVVVDLGLRDYTVQRTVSRQLGDLVFDAGEWRAVLGDGKPYHGYYSALLRQNRDGVKIIEETTNVGSPSGRTPRGLMPDGAAIARRRAARA